MVTDPNQGATKETLDQLKEASYERMRLQLFEAVEKKLQEFGMTWDDLAHQIPWMGVGLTGEETRNAIGVGDISISLLNNIAHCFSAEAYIIFRPRFPITQT